MRKNSRDSEKVSIPKTLYIGILKIQVDEKLTWEEACQVAAARLDRNSEEYKKDVAVGAEKRYKSRFMTSFNKSKPYIVRRSRLDGYSEAMKIEHFTAPCNRCGKSIEFRSTHNNWDTEVKPILNKAFRNWAHDTCLGNRKKDEIEELAEWIKLET